MIRARSLSTLTLLAAVAVGAVSCGSNDGGDGDVLPVAALVTASAVPESSDVAVTINLEILSLDSLGDPVHFAPLTYSVLAGGGSASGPATTDDNGLAIASWHLGNRAGANTLRIESPGAPPLDLAIDAVGLPDVYQIWPDTPDDQTGEPGQPVPIPPRVTVVDTALVPIAGVPLLVTASAGSYTTVDTVITDSLGKTGVPIWVLGDQVKSGAGGDRYQLHFQAVPSSVHANFYSTAVFSGPVNVTIPTPAVNAVINDTLRISAAVTSTFQLASVVAVVGALTDTLAFNGGNGRWEGALYLGTIADGPFALVVTARDINDSLGSATRPFLHDAPPVPIVSAPLPYTVARPLIGVALRCTGCVSLSWEMVGEHGLSTVITAPDSIVGDISLAFEEGQQVTIRARVVDASGQAAGGPDIAVYVESSAKLSQVIEMPSEILDHKGGRTLSKAWSAQSAILHDAGAGTTDTISGQPGDVVREGVLFSTGVVLVVQRPGSTFWHLLRWTGGGMDDIPIQHYAVNGDFLVYSQAVIGGYVPLTRMDLTTGTTVTPPLLAGNTDNAVSPAGDIALWNDDSLTFIQADVGHRVDVDSATYTVNVYPRTDGGHVLFTRQTPCCGAVKYQIQLFDGTTTTTVADLGTYQPMPDHDYRVAGGWAAWVVPAAGNVRQVWTRSPAGTRRQISFFGTSSTIDALGTDGSVIFTNGGRRYYVAPAPAAATPMDVASGKFQMGRVIWDGGDFYELLGRSVFQVTP